MDTSSNILAEAQTYVSAFLKERTPQWARYHTLQHTEQTVAAAREIAEGTELNDADKEIVLLAAWFHDTGYTQIVEGHEELGVRIASQFLQHRQYPGEKINQVAACIRATKIPQHPHGTLEQILSDADLSHLGNERFFERSDLLRTEIELRTGRSLPDSEWMRNSIAFTSSGSFFTEYARSAWTDRRNGNIRELREQLNRELAAEKQEI